MAKLNKNGKANVMLHIPPEIYKRFKVNCVRNDAKIYKTIESLMNKYSEETEMKAFEKKLNELEDTK